MSRLANYYAFRDNWAHNCWNCDRVNGCKCSDVEKRAAKRGAKQRHRREMLAQIDGAA